MTKFYKLYFYIHNNAFSFRLPLIASIYTTQLIAIEKAIVYSRSKEKKNPNYSNTNYCREMKLVTIIMDYHLLQFDALKFLLGIRPHGRFLSNFNFFNVNPQI